MSDINSNDSAPTTDADVVQDPSSAAPAPSPEPSSVDAPAPQEAAAGSDDAGEHGDADEHGDDEHGDDDHDDGSESGEAAEGGEGTEGGGKRKRRRRKKKKPEVDNSQKSAHVPFLRYFDGRGTKTHAFAAGEVVAGRVAKLTNTTIFVDLFGKGLAVVDVYEPREVPALPEPVVAPEASAAAEAGEAAAAEGTEGEAPVAAEANDEHHDEHEHDEHDDEDHEGHTSAGFLEAMEAAGPPPELPAMGGIVRGRISSVSESGHIVLVNRIIDRGATKARIAAARDAKLRVRGMVYGFNRGGFDVLVDGVRAFCPARAMSLTEITGPGVVRRPEARLLAAAPQGWRAQHHRVAPRHPRARVPQGGSRAHEAAQGGRAPAGHRAPRA
ncbi:MAG: hypothetical protein IPG81_33865 [Sandaracinaceae bacterium]|nr:hypothetical protein [Sandaracinaceae bacterium]